MLRFAIASGVVALLSLPAVAGEISPATTITAVTVFPTGANITRTVPVELPAGSSTVIVPDLPGEIETDSIKVEGTADQAIEIGSVETRTVPADEEADPARKAILDRIRALDDKLAAIADGIEALEARRDFIEELAEALPEGFSNAIARPFAGQQNWAEASKMIGDDFAAVAEAIRALHAEERSIKKEIEKEKEALDELPPLTDHVEVRIALAAAAPANGRLTLTYRAPSAQWAPAYDAQLATGEGGAEPKLTIVRRAEVSQSTGEDWSGVALVLSTARPSGGTALPDYQPLFVMLQEQYDYARDSLSAGAPPPAPAMSVAEAEAGEPPEEKAVTIAEAAADFGDFRAEYRIPGNVSIESGEGARLLRISSEEVVATLEVRAAPEVSPTAFLSARFATPAGAPLLAGRVALFRDGAFVGTGSIAFTNPGDELTLGFGADDAVKVTRTELDRTTGESGLLSSRKTDLRSFRITVENLHKRPVTITVYDRVPYAENEDITIERLAETTAPTAENVDDRRGVIAWTDLYQPGESRDIKLAYQLSWPADESLVER